MILKVDDDVQSFCSNCLIMQFIMLRISKMSELISRVINSSQAKTVGQKHALIKEINSYIAMLFRRIYSPAQSWT
jgi:hypothetical protein